MAYYDLDAMKPLPKHAQKVFSGQIFDTYQWEQELFDGSTATYERVVRQDYSYLIGVTPDEQIMLVTDEQPHRIPVLTPAGGKVENGEEPHDAAVREFREETGYEAQEVVPWHSYRPSSTYIQMAVHAFIGRNIEKVAEPAMEAGEKITPQLYSFDEFLALGQGDELRDWMLRVKLLQAQLDESKREDLKRLLYG